MKAFFRAAWAPLVASVLLACATAGSPGPGNEEQTHSLAAPIIGGYLDTATHGVVALAFKVHKQVAVFCSGSLLAPNLVLTARHCIAQLGDGSSETVDCSVTQFTAQYDAAQIFVSTDAEPQTSNGTLYSVKEIRQAPGSSNVCGYDVALLILDSNVPSSAATPIEPALGIKTKADTVFSAVGYGLQNATDTQGTTAGSRMRFDSSDVYCVGGLCPTGIDVSNDEFVGNSPVCSGDSGGPALDAKGRVFGVTSRGDSDCTYALYSNVADWSDFIRSAGQDAATAGAYSPAVWVTNAGIITVNPGGTGGNSAGGNSAGSAGGSSAGGQSSSGGAQSSSGGSNMGNAGKDTSSAGSTSDTPPPVQSVTPTVSPLGVACESADDCPGKYKCWSSSGKPPGICVPTCSTPCPSGYQCSDALNVCTPKQDTVVTGHASASCALSTQPYKGNGALAAALLLGSAWLGRRRRTAT